ncbi:hypothetical protein NDU88_003546 [Pleurodeles waltl]|uniref:Uncharacterized protein n=1 Tax=Pleurodeles waltl TaxID=8319 RepID=A0AAV7T5H1_PLEWA|nr:hypothetical protein NDU88_003546 [Pleurodeles waltl]
MPLSAPGVRSEILAAWGDFRCRLNRPRSIIRASKRRGHGRLGRAFKRPEANRRWCDQGKRDLAGNQRQERRRRQPQPTAIIRKGEPGGGNVLKLESVA